MSNSATFWSLNIRPNTFLSIKSYPIKRHIIQIYSGITSDSVLTGELVIKKDLAHFFELYPCLK